MARPTTYNAELGAYVCKMIATHSCGLKKLEKMYEDFPYHSTIYAWIYDFPEFSAGYLEARRLQAAVLADSMLDISEDISTFEDKDGVERIDSGILGRSKLNYEILKWHASKMAPKIFGDKQIVEQTTSENEALKAEIALMREQLDATSKRDY